MLSNNYNLFFATQISLRILATATTLSASWITLTNKQTVLVYGITTTANYTYSPAFKFFAFANMIVSVFSLLSLFAAIMLGKKAVDPSKYFYVFLHDLSMTTVLMAGCAAATAVGEIGKYGNSHAGWTPICPYFVNYCRRSTVGTMLSYVGMLLYFLLTIFSAQKSRGLHVSV